MSTQNVTHGGGPAGSAIVGTSAEIVMPRNRRRKYAIITADEDNTAPVFVLLSQERPDTDPIVIGDFSTPPVTNTGIPLYPGSAYEIDEEFNLFQGHILAISTAAAQRLFTQEGV